MKGQTLNHKPCIILANSFALTGLEITGRKDAKCVCFFHIAPENSQGRQKMCVHISASVAHKLYLCPVPKCVFSVFNFRITAAGGYNSTGLSVSLVLNHRSFVQDWETSASDITRVKNPKEVLTC